MSDKQIRPNRTKGKSQKPQPRTLMLTLGGTALLVMGGSLAFFPTPRRSEIWPVTLRGQGGSERGDVEYDPLY